MVKTPHFHCRRHGFSPWPGNQDSPRTAPRPPTAKKKKKFLPLEGSHGPLENSF